MHTIENVSQGRQQVRTLDQGLVFMDPGDTLTATIEASYAKLLRRSLVLRIADAPEGAAPGLVPAASSATGAEGEGSPAEARQNGADGGDSNDSEPRNRDEWAKLAESKGIEVKKSWGINRIKTELEQLP